MPDKSSSAQPHRQRFRRGLANLLLPYSSRLGNGLNLCVFSVGIVFMLVDGYAVVHALPGWPWENRSSLYATYTLPVHYSEKDNHVDLRLWAAFLLPLAPLIIWGVLGVWKRPLWTTIQWKHIYPFFVLSLASAQLWNTSSLNDTLRFTGDGIWFRWGMVRWSHVQSYHWSRPIGTFAVTTSNGLTVYRDEPTSNDALTLHVPDDFPYPRTLTWVIPSWRAQQVDHILIQYLPRRGNHPPRSS